MGISQKDLDSAGALSASSPDAVIIINSEGVIISWNKSAERIFGHTESDMVGSPLTLVIPEEYHALHHKGLERVLAGGERRVIGSTVELSGLHKEGHAFPIEMSLGTWTADGERYFSAFIRDITERVKLNSDLKATENRLRAILDSANDAIVTIDELGVIRSRQDGYQYRVVHGWKLWVRG